MKHLEKSEVKNLLRVAKKYSDRDWLMMLTAYRHGLRASEVCELEARDIRDGEIVCRRKKGSMKTIQPLEASLDPILDEKTAFEAIVNQLNPTDRLFPVTRKTFWRAFQKYHEEAGIKKSLAHPHIMKHSVAMHGVKAGIENLRVKLGHKSLNSTGMYLKIDDATACKAVADVIGEL